MEDGMSLKKSLPIINHENAALCEPCGGQCCKSAPGITHPDEWGSHNRDVMLASLTEALASGKYAVDWWEDAEPLYYVRPATVKGQDIYDPSWGGTCVMLRDDGCSLAHDARPFECRTLEPRTGTHCVQHSGGKLAMAKRWRKYRDVIQSAASAAEELREAAQNSPTNTKVLDQ